MYQRVLTNVVPCTTGEFQGREYDRVTVSRPFLLLPLKCAGQRFIAALSHTGGRARKNVSAMNAKPDCLYKKQLADSAI